MKSRWRIPRLVIGLLVSLNLGCDSQKKVEKALSPREQERIVEANQPVGGAIRIPSLDLERVSGAMREEVQRAIEAVKQRPLDAELWGELAQVLHATEFEKQASECYREATRLDPTNQRWWHLLGILVVAQTPSPGIEALRNAVSLEGQTNPVSRFKLAQVLAERGETQEAEAILNKLLQLDEHHSGARLELGRVWMYQGKLVDAEPMLIRCLTNAFTARPAALLLSQLKARSGDESTAKALMDRAQRMPRPFDWPDPFLHGVQRRKQNLGEKLELIQQAISRQSFEQAENLLEALVRSESENAELWLMRGRLRMVQRRCEEATEAFERHLVLRRDSLNGHVQLGLARSCLGKWELASESFQNAVKLKPDFGSGHYNLGIVKSKTGDLEGAVTAFERALECDPGDLNILVALAEHLGQVGRKEKAIHYFTEAERLHRGDDKVNRLRKVLFGEAKPKKENGP